MSTIDDIQFNRYIYEHAMHWALLLYQVTGISVVIPIPNADLLTFIRVLNDSTECYELIERNPPKIITLFAYENNIRQWLANETNLPDNLRSIKIFCHADDQFFVTGWIQRHRQLFNTIVFDILDFDNLNHNLLLFGLKHIRELRREFEHENGILNLLDEDYRRICSQFGR